jgi:hypothetical protein
MTADEAVGAGDYTAVGVLRHGPAQVGMGTAPLRKVIGRQQYRDTELWQDILECGHAVNEASDAFGAKAEGRRRRCIYCKAGTPTAASGGGS